MPLTAQSTPAAHSDLAAQNAALRQLLAATTADLEYWHDIALTLMERLAALPGAELSEPAPALTQPAAARLQ